MDSEQGVGWIAAIIIGGLAGFLAEKFMKTEMGLVMTVILGIVGAALANLLLGMVGISLGGWIGYLVAGVIGAVILIANRNISREPVFLMQLSAGAPERPGR